MRLATVLMFGFLLFSFRHVMRPAAHGAKKVSQGVYHAVV